MKVLIACEESQAVTKAFRELGHEAYSCDILPCSGGHPEWHYQQDVFEIINKGWDLMIAHPPCTYLAVISLLASYNSAILLAVTIKLYAFFKVSVEAMSSSLCSTLPFRISSSGLEPD